MTKRKWVPAPTFLYRNYLYRKLLATVPKGFFLEIGTGNGFFLKHLASEGFSGEAIDISVEALEVAKEQLDENADIKLYVCDIFDLPKLRTYDLIFLFEVLEHIQDDHACLQKVYTHLNEGGYLLLSVPAHSKQWKHLDTLKGHYRRYEKADLIDLLERCGFEIEEFLCYGFPFSNALRFIDGIVKARKVQKPRDKATRESSIDLEYNPRFAFLVRDRMLYPLFRIMDLFLRTDLGIGYLVKARKPASKTDGHQ